MACAAPPQSRFHRASASSKYRRASLGCSTLVLTLLLARLASRSVTVASRDMQLPLFTLHHSSQLCEHGFACFDVREQHREILFTARQSFLCA